MMRTFLCLFIAAVLSACAGKNVREKETRDATPVDSASVIEVKSATEFTSRTLAESTGVWSVLPITTDSLWSGRTM